jgi:hypothetical protein
LLEIDATPPLNIDATASCKSPVNPASALHLHQLGVQRAQQRGLPLEPRSQELVAFAQANGISYNSHYLPGG